MHFKGTLPAGIGQGIRLTTYHGLLVAWGRVAQWFGLRQVLDEKLHVRQKIYQHSPVAKVIETPVAILGGCRYMKDLNHAAEPVVADKAVCKAWGVQKFAHFSTVCRTLKAFTAENVQELETALGAIMSPLLRARAEAVAGPNRQRPLLVDIDLTGQKVRGEAQQYTGTAFGYIQGTLARGYQIAAAFLSTRKLRLAIAGHLKPGDAHAASCLLDLLPAIETRIGRPRRRVEWVQAAIGGLLKEIHQACEELSSLPDKGSGPRRKALLRRMEAIEHQVAQLQARLTQYQQDNATNPRPFRIVLRADSAFGTTEVIQRCLEMGYDLVLKRYTINTFRHLWDQAPAEAWVQVGKKRQASEQLPLPALPLPAPFQVRQIALRRWDANNKEVRSVLVTTFKAEEQSLQEVVAAYEGRQSIEAGFQEWKGPFQFGNPRLRSYQANAVFLQLVLFGFNLIRWAWLLMQTTSQQLRKAGSKMLLHVAGCCRATVWLTEQHLRLKFSRGTSLRDIEVLVPPPKEGLPDTAGALFAPNLS